MRQSEQKDVPKAGPPRRRVHCKPTYFHDTYTEDQVEFLRAIQKFKHDAGNPFPSWTQVLDVLLSLGYRKVAQPSE